MADLEVTQLRKGSMPPLFAIHGSGGILAFAKIARHLDTEQAMYVVKGAGLDDSADGFDSMDSLATQYHQRIREIHPEGPLLLCGRETRVLIAVAARALDENDVAPLLVAFDTAPHINPYYRAPPRRRRALKDTAYRMLSSMRTLIHRDRIDDDPGKSTAVNLELTRDFDLDRYHDRVVYIQSDAYRNNPKQANHLERWRAFADVVDYHSVPGGHGSMFEPPNVEVLARLVQLECNRAVANG